MTLDTEMAARLERLEAHVAHLERQCDELNQVIIEQGRMLRSLQAGQRRMAETLETQELERIRTHVTKPPHYQ